MGDIINSPTAVKSGVPEKVSKSPRDRNTVNNQSHETTLRKIISLRNNSKLCLRDPDTLCKPITPTGSYLTRNCIPGNSSPT